MYGQIIQEKILYFLIPKIINNIKQNLKNWTKKFDKIGKCDIIIASWKESKSDNECTKIETKHPSSIEKYFFLCKKSLEVRYERR